ncbi:MAG: hypothetical protein KA764_04585 [Anaerolineales bacterium]|nr:hypothetical protein [Anaerolineales bacterium]
MSDFAAFALWYLAVSAAGLLALPLAFRLFRALPERGYALARPLGLLAAGYVFWALGSLGFLRNEAASVWVAAGLVLAAGLVWLGRAGLGELRGWLRAQAGYVLRVEALYLAAFALLAVVRAYNPDIVSTEKPMELMFINAILRSPAFPPNDAWLSGHAISYYYFGYLLIAALIKVTGVASAVAFNLGLAMLFALTVTGSLGVAVNLLALTQTPDAGRPPAVVQKVFWPALLAPLMIVAAGNFYGVVRLAHANGWLADLAVPAVYYHFGDAALGEPAGLRAGLVNVWTWLDLKGANTPPAPPAQPGFNWDPGFWWWFNGARITHDRNLVGQETEAITEVPAFSFVLGDLHPHVLGLPFVFVALALGLNWLLWAAGLARPPVRTQAAAQSAADVQSEFSAAAEPRVPSAAGRRSWDPGFPVQPLIPDLFVSALILGGLSFLNTWDFPIYLFVVVMALALGLGLAWGWDELWRRWTVVAAFAGALVGLGFGLYLPFYFTFQSQAGGLLPNLIYPTRLPQTVVLFAQVLLASLLYVGWLAVRARRSLDWRAALWTGGGLLGFLILAVAALSVGAWLNPQLASFIDGFIAPLSRTEALALLFQRRLVDSLTSLLAAGLIGLCAGLAVGALRRPTTNLQSSNLPIPNSLTRSPAVLFTLLLVLTGALLLLGPEFVYLRDNFGTRMNTIFKFYFQAWVLWGLAGAFGIWLIQREARPGVGRAAGMLVGVALAAGLLYTVPAVWSKANHFSGPATLDGLAYFAQQHPDDWAAIQWLQANVAGAPGAASAPVIAEGIGGQYWIEGRFSRIAMATGLPTVMGWPGHEAQWRGRAFDAVSEREGQIQQLYQVRDWTVTQAILTRYNIEYVVVSGLERQKYGVIYQAKFDAYMRPVFQSGDVTIYQRLAGAP